MIPSDFNEPNDEWDEGPIEELRKAVKREKETAKREPVTHYETPGGIECIDYIRSLGMLQEFAAGNCLKYVTRAGRKDGNSKLEDLKKARTYLDFMISDLEGDWDGRTNSR